MNATALIALVIASWLVVSAAAAMLLGSICSSGTRPGDRRENREWEQFQAAMRR